MREHISPRRTRLEVPAHSGPLLTVVARSARLSIRRGQIDVSLVVHRTDLLDRVIDGPVTF